MIALVSHLRFLLSICYLISLTEAQLSFPECGKYAELREDTRENNFSHSPWNVLIQINVSDSTAKCGGVLISNAFVLTAAQCFCKSKSHSCARFRRKNGTEIMLRPLYDYKKAVRLFMGLKHIRLDSESHPIEDVLIHPEFKKTFHNDIALIQLKGKVNISRDINPICLPFGPGFPDTASRGFVDGWKTPRKNCSTDEFGPSPSTPCQFPFIYKGQSFSRCLLTQPPTNEVCLAYEKRILRGVKVKRNEVAKIIYHNGTLTDCYSSSEGDMGWCGTCSPGKTDCDNAIVTSNGNWGWCLKSTCSERRDEELPHKYISKGEEFTIFEGEKCTGLFESTSSNHSFDPESQLCAGKLNSTLRKKKLFDLVENIGDDGESAASFFQKDSKFETELFTGEAESCEGGLGGPLWRWMGIHEKRAFVVGIVSRGFGCFEEATPGVYTRTRSFLPWILRNIRKEEDSKLLRIEINKEPKSDK